MSLTFALGTGRIVAFDEASVVVATPHSSVVEVGYNTVSAGRILLHNQVNRKM